ncbi:hypothetical protein K7432_015057 [Basidiobolus ranarum]|uniref:Uncharacterized protein n=1 Tax=Basidiobolus ranarum TaxID=34480 RepID=A0ABR2VNL9_9FUNG
MNMNEELRNLLLSDPLLCATMKLFRKARDSRQIFCIAVAAILVMSEEYELKLLSFEKGEIFAWFQDKLHLSIDLTYENFNIPQDKSIIIKQLEFNKYDYVSINFSTNEALLVSGANFGNQVNTEPPLCDVSSQSEEANDEIVLQPIQEKSARRIPKHQDSLDQNHKWLKEFQYGEYIDPPVIKAKVSQKKFLSLTHNLEHTFNQKKEDFQYITNIEDLLVNISDHDLQPGKNCTILKAIILSNSAVENLDSLQKKSLVLMNIESYRLALFYISFARKQLRKHPELWKLSKIGQARNFGELIQAKCLKLDSTFNYASFTENLRKAIKVFLIANFIGIRILQYPAVITPN